MAKLYFDDADFDGQLQRTAASVFWARAVYDWIDASLARRTGPVRMAMTAPP
jgi:hypothetical protein